MAAPDEKTSKQAQQTEAQQGTSNAGPADEPLVAPGIEEDTVPDLQVELEAALQEIDKLKDMAMRAEAEAQNVRRRAQRDVENAHKFGSEKLISNLLPVIDSLEKAVESAEQAEGAAEASSKAIIEGVGLCLKMLVDLLGKEGVVVVNPEGEPFDPNLHQAMSMVEAPNVEPNSVVAVVQKGYTLNERLVRPAMVMVSRAPTKVDE